MKRKPYIYILACADDTYYVGFTRWLHQRLGQHFIGDGAVFTKLHKPLSVLMYREAKNEEDEYKAWRKFADVFGYKKVGGYNPSLCKKFGFEWPYYNGKMK